MIARSCDRSIYVLLISARAYTNPVRFSASVDARKRLKPASTEDGCTNRFVVWTFQVHRITKYHNPGFFSVAINSLGTDADEVITKALT